MKRSRYPMFITTLLTMLVFSATSAIPALADDSVPPPPIDVSVVIDTPTVNEVTEIAPADVEPISTEVPVVDEQPAPVDTAISDLFAAVPNGTDVVITNAEGESIPIASTEAADAIVNGDPMWCPAGVAPKENTGGCINPLLILAFLAMGMRSA